MRRNAILSKFFEDPISNLVSVRGADILLLFLYILADVFVFIDASFFAFVTTVNARTREPSMTAEDVGRRRLVLADTSEHQPTNVVRQCRLVCPCVKKDGAAAVTLRLYRVLSLLWSTYKSGNSGVTVTDCVTAILHCVVVLPVQPFLEHICIAWVAV